MSKEINLSNVVGHTNQKKELLTLIEWFNNSKELKEKNLSIPKGALLYGSPGNGKSLLIKEIINNIDAKVFVFHSTDESNVAQGIDDMFSKAREAGKAIVVIDELDLLINKERRVIRALQENLDGVESTDDILVLAATNDIDEIPDALLRNGRLEKIIHIPYLEDKEAFELFKRYFDLFNIKLPEDIDADELGLSLSRVSCAGIKSIVNDIVLRNGYENISEDMIYDSIYNITDRVKHSDREKNKAVAIHEASHAVMAASFPQYFKIKKLEIDGPCGGLHCKEVEENYWNFDKAKADIMICLAGTIGERIINHMGSRGCENDLDKARSSAYNLYNRCGMDATWEVLPAVDRGTRRESYVKLRRMERKAEKLLRQCEKKVYKYLRSNVDKINKLADVLFDKQHMKSTEILKIIND